MRWKEGGDSGGRSDMERVPIKVEPANIGRRYRNHKNEERDAPPIAPPDWTHASEDSANNYGLNAI